jgi:hypothetical protein
LDAQDEDACRNHDKIEVDSMNVDLEISSKIKKAGYNVQCVTNIWSIGKEMIAGDKIKEKRVSAKRRFGRKLDMMREIGELIESAKSMIIRDIRLRDEEGIEFESADWVEDIKILSKFG